MTNSKFLLFVFCKQIISILHIFPKAVFCLCKFVKRHYPRCVTDSLLGAECCLASSKVILTL